MKMKDKGHDSLGVRSLVEETRYLVNHSSTFTHHPSFLHLPTNSYLLRTCNVLPSIVLGTGEYDNETERQDLYSSDRGVQWGKQATTIKCGECYDRIKTGYSDNMEQGCHW